MYKLLFVVTISSFLFPFAVHASTQESYVPPSPTDPPVVEQTIPPSQPERVPDPTSPPERKCGFCAESTHTRIEHKNPNSTSSPTPSVQGIATASPAPVKKIMKKAPTPLVVPSPDASESATPSAILEPVINNVAQEEKQSFFQQFLFWILALFD